MRCQVWTGSGIKYYWVRVSSSDGDTITVPISEFEGVQPEEGDECVLMGNTDNPLRQNLISISATEDGQPRIDVLNGVKSKSFEGCLRARLGNLDGISDNYFPADNQPHGDGLYADNAYLRGTFVLSTGEDVKTRFEILEGRISSEIQSVEKELMAYESYLRNAYFNDNMDGWETDNGVTFFLIGNKWIWLNDKPYANKTAYTGITTDRNRTVLYIKNRYLLQRNENFESHPVCDEKDIDGKFLPKKFYLSFFYRCITPGTLKIEFEGANQDGFSPFEMLSVNQEIEATGEEYKTFETTGLWNGTGDFRLSFSGEMYLYAVRLSLDRIADIEQRYKTFFEQTDKKFTLAAEERAETTRKLEEYHSEMIITAKEIRSEVSQSITNLETGLTEKLNTAISQTAEQIKVVANRFNEDGSIKNTAGLVTTAEANKMFAFDSAGNLVSFIEQTASNIKIKAKNISLEGLVTANGNFKILEDGSIETNNAKLRGYMYSVFKPIRSSDATELGYNKTTYNVEYRLNTNIFVDATFNGVVLPVSVDYEGARVIIMDSHFVKTRTITPPTTIRTEDGSPIFSGLFYQSRDATEHYDQFDAEIMEIDSGTIELVLQNCPEYDEETGEVVSYNLRWILINNSCQHLSWTRRGETYEYRYNAW